MSSGVSTDKIVHIDAAAGTGTGRGSDRRRGAGTPGAAATGARKPRPAKRPAAPVAREALNAAVGKLLLMQSMAVCLITGDPGKAITDAELTAISEPAVNILVKHPAIAAMLVATGDLGDYGQLALAIGMYVAVRLPAATQAHLFRMVGLASPAPAPAAKAEAAA